jgi:Family of unknown function (DUF6270)
MISISKLEYGFDTVKLFLGSKKDSLSNDQLVLRRRKADSPNKYEEIVKQNIDGTIGSLEIDIKKIKFEERRATEIIDVYALIDGSLRPLVMDGAFELKYLQSKVDDYYYIKPYRTKSGNVALFLTVDLMVSLHTISMQEDNLLIECSMNKTVRKAELLIGNKLFHATTVNDGVVTFKIPVKEALGVNTDYIFCPVEVKCSFLETFTVTSVITVHNNVSFQSSNFDVHTISNENGLHIAIKNKNNNDKVRVAVLGCCVTRDNFNTKFNPDYKTYYECTLLQNQTSIISLMGNAIEFPSDEIIGLNDYDLWNVKTDFEKSFLQNLVEQNPHYLIIDIFADVFFGCIRVGDSYITNNYWKLNGTAYYSNLEKRDFMKVTLEREEYLQQWRESIDKLFSFLRNNLPNCKVIIHQARFTNHYYDREHSRQRFQNNLNIAMYNSIWDEMDSYIEASYDVKAISLQNHHYISIEDHPWGLFNVHFEFDYYHAFLSKLHQIVLEDYLEDKNETIQSINQALRG